MVEEDEEGETVQEERERERGEEYSDSGPQGRKEQQQQQQPRPRPRPRGGQRPRRPQTGIFLCSQLKRGVLEKTFSGSDRQPQGQPQQQRPRRPQPQQQQPRRQQPQQPKQPETGVNIVMYDATLDDDDDEDVPILFADPFSDIRPPQSPNRLYEAPPPGKRRR